MERKLVRSPESRTVRYWFVSVVAGATFLAPAAACVASVPVSTAATAGIDRSAGAVTSAAEQFRSDEVFQLAAGRKANAAPKPPERGSSATIYGGSSADRYGGSSADRAGVAGDRDSRLYRRTTKHEAGPSRSAKPEEDRQDEEEAEE